MRTSCPTAANTTTRPVSWHIGSERDEAISAFCRMRSRVFTARGLDSRRLAWARAARMSSLSSKLAFLHIVATASRIWVTVISFIAE